MKNLVAAALICVSLQATTSCKPGTLPMLSQIEQVVLTDLEAGDTVEQIEADVEAISPAGADIIAIVGNAIAVLRDLGVIPAANLENAKAMLVKITVARAAAASAK